MMLERYPKALAACPADFWQRLTLADSGGVVVRFLHHLFAHDGKVLDFSQTIWRIVRERHPAYARAARESLARVLAESDERALGEIVRLDAARPHARHGRRWLERLAAAMEHGDFTTLDEDGA
jgi:hypothetical protein